MNILVVGGTRFFGIPMIEELLKNGHEVTIATRGLTKDNFGNRITRIIMDRSNPESIQNALSHLHFDVVIDKIAYSSNDIKHLMEYVSCDRYIYMSTTAVYHPLHMDTKEDAFSGVDEALIWCDRADYSYDVVKRQAEYALCQVYGDRKWLAVRYPVVMGKDDYTKRLYFYVEHVIKEIPMYIDNLDCQMGFIRSDEAGRFLAFLVDTNITGAMNGCSDGTISLKEIIDYVELKTGKKTILDQNGDPASYNGQCEYSVNTSKAKSLGYQFSNVRDWIFDLLDDYIGEIENEE